MWDSCTSGFIDEWWEDVGNGIVDVKKEETVVNGVAFSSATVEVVVVGIVKVVLVELVDTCDGVVPANSSYSLPGINSNSG